MAAAFGLFVRVVGAHHSQTSVSVQTPERDGRQQGVVASACAGSWEPILQTQREHGACCIISREVSECASPTPGVQRRVWPGAQNKNNALVYVISLLLLLLVLHSECSCTVLPVCLVFPLTASDHRSTCRAGTTNVPRFCAG